MALKQNKYLRGYKLTERKKATQPVRNIILFCLKKKKIPWKISPMTLYNLACDIFFDYNAFKYPFI